MSYQISCYSDRAMQHRESAQDTIGEALDKYPAPTGREVAFARHSESRDLDAYGCQTTPP